MMNTILKKINGFLVTISMATMVFSPVAMGKQAQAEADRISQAELEQFVQELGLNKSMTVGEFYKKNKDQFPPRIQKMIEPLMTQFKNEAMPQFEVTQAKNSKGENIATLRLTGKDQLSSIQFLGEEGKFVKFDNTNLTLEDVVNFDDMFAKLYFGDASHRKGMGFAVTSPRTLPKNTKVTPPAKFVGTPKITQEMWKKMTPMERAQFMMNMRMLWSGAQDVLDAKEASKNINSKGKKTSSLDKWNSFFAMLDEAQAADTKCVVAGYIGNYAADKKCKYPAGAKATGCNYPCNPTIYGFDSNGKQFCLNNSAELQTATHFNKGCDAKMPLTSVALSLPATASKRDASRYQGIIEANKVQALNDPSSMANTKKYLDSMLHGTPELRDAFQKGNITADLLAKLQEIQTQFDSTITAARNDCAAAAAEAQYDRNFWGACDQLHKRFLFVAAYLEKNPGCKGGGKVDETTLTCSCSNGPAVAPGAECASVPDPTPVGPGPDPSTPVVGKCDPECKAGEVCEKTSADASGAEVWECKIIHGDKPVKDEKKPGFFAKLWKGIKKVGPWVIGGAALWLLWAKILKPKKPKLNSAGDACPNGTIPPCGQVCTPPKALLSSGTCGCPACPPGQTLTNANSCLCENTTVTNTIYVCADGVTQVSDLANCPTTQYLCPGTTNTYVTNLLNCPESTPVAPKPVDSTR